MFTRQPTESDAQALARLVDDPSVTGGRNLLEWTARNRPIRATAVQQVIEELRKQAEAVAQSDLSILEPILTSQAHILNTIFNDLSQITRQNLSSNLEAFDRLLRLALRAQTQCRATLETLAEIKNPTSVTFVRQANIAHGPQQVNNAPPTASRARGSNRNPANQPIGTERWQTAGLWNGGQGSRRRSENGDRGSDRRDHGRLRARSVLPEMPIVGAGEQKSDGSYTPTSGDAK